MNSKICLFFGLIFYLNLLLFQGTLCTQIDQPEMTLNQRLPNKTLKMIETTIRIVEIIDDQDRENDAKTSISDSTSENRSVRYATIERKTEKLQNIHSIVQLSCFEKYFSVTPRQGRIIMPMKTTVRIVDIINDAGRENGPMGSRRKVDLCSEDQTDLTVRIVEIQRSESERTSTESATMLSEFADFDVKPTEEPKLTTGDEKRQEMAMNELESEKFNDAMEALTTASTPTTHRLLINDLDSEASELTSQMELPTTVATPTPSLIDGNLNANQTPAQLWTTGSAMGLLEEVTTRAASSMPIARKFERKMDDDKQSDVTESAVTSERSLVEVTTSSMSDISGSNLLTEVNQPDLNPSETTASNFSIESLPPTEFALKVDESQQTTTIAVTAGDDVATTSATINDLSSDIDLIMSQVDSSTMPSINAGNVDTTEMPMSDLKSKEMQTATHSRRLSDESMNPELTATIPPVDTVTSATQVSISGSENDDLFTTTELPLINLPLLTDGPLEANYQIVELSSQSAETTTGRAMESTANESTIEMNTEMSQAMSTMQSEISIETTTTKPTVPSPTPSVPVEAPKNQPTINPIESTEMPQQEMTTESTNLSPEMTTISSQPEFSTETVTPSAELSTTNAIFEPKVTTTVASIENPTTTSSIQAIEMSEPQMTTESRPKSSIELTTVAPNLVPQSGELATEFPLKMDTLSTENPTTASSIEKAEMTQPKITTESFTLPPENTVKPTQLESLTEETTLSSTEPPPTTQTPIETTTLRSEVNLSGKSRSVEATFINYNTPKQPIKESLLLRFKSKSLQADIGDQKLFELLYTIFLLNRFEKHAQSSGVPGKRLAKIRIKIVEMSTEEEVSSAQTEVITTRPTEAAHQLGESVPETTTVNSTSTFYTERLKIGSPESENNKMASPEMPNNSIEVKLRITGIINENRTENGRITQSSTRIEPIDITLDIEGQGTADLMAALSKPLEARLRIGKVLEKPEQLPKIDSNELPILEKDSEVGKRIEPRMVHGNETTEFSSSTLEFETTTQIETELASLESQPQPTRVSMIQEISLTTETSPKDFESQLTSTESPTTTTQIPEATTEFINSTPESTTEPLDTRESFPTTKPPKLKISLANILQPASNRTGKAFNYNLSKSEISEKDTGPTDLHWIILKIMVIFIVVILVISLLFCCIHRQSSKESASETQPKRLETDDSFFESSSRNVV